MRCGQCHDEHETAADVRNCYAGAGRFSERMAQRFLGGKITRFTPGATSDEDEAWARAIRADRLPPAARSQAPASQPEGTKSDIARLFARYTMPAGHYAVPSRTGNNDLDFYRVDRPKQGNWAGCLFAKRIIGGHPPIRISKGEQMGALARIQKFGWEKAAKLYADETGECARCRIHLTDDASRVLGLGETCAGYRGLAAEWKRLDRDLNKKDKTDARS